MELLRSNRRRRVVRMVLGTAVVAAALVTTALTVPPASAQDQLQYVALGDSSAAGPGLEPVDDAVCQRSSQNWPHRLATLLNVTLKDVTCSGAVIAHLTGQQLGSVPPQLEAVNDGTDLVTLAIGANDIGGGAAMLVCSARNEFFPADMSCPDRLSAAGINLPQLINQAEQNLAAKLDEIRKKTTAPVVLVGYLTYWDVNGCRDRDDFTAEAANHLQGALDEWMARMRAQASEADRVSYVDIREPSRRHGVCATDQQWLAGNIGDTNPGSYHPTALGMEEAAKIIAPHASRVLQAG